MNLGQSDGGGAGQDGPRDAVPEPGLRPRISPAAPHADDETTTLLAEDPRLRRFPLRSHLNEDHAAVAAGDNHSVQPRQRIVPPKAELQVNGRRCGRQACAGTP
jgi:hypothetical protein